MKVSGSVANHKLALSVFYSGFYEWRRELTYKSAIYGTVVEVVDRWYPSSKTCSNYGHVQLMPLQAPIFVS
ncbi:transposase [Microcoleus vaginatus]|uniref:transposase n=1 Tax=Microcoleus vaginatus TaxID=119532 RepID=UPI001F612CC9|nr:hypothetical protein D0A37_00580 [Microcoleus vaginatus HSN003]